MLDQVAHQAVGSFQANRKQWKQFKVAFIVLLFPQCAPALHLPITTKDKAAVYNICPGLVMMSYKSIALILTCNAQSKVSIKMQLRLSQDFQMFGKRKCVFVFSSTAVLLCSLLLFDPCSLLPRLYFLCQVLFVCSDHELHQAWWGGKKLLLQHPDGEPARDGAARQDTSQSGICFEPVYY